MSDAHAHKHSLIPRVVVTVGETQDWLPELVARAKGLKVGNGFDPSTEMYALPCHVPRRARLTPLSGPLITPAAKERVERLVASCAAEGGNIALDGRGVVVPGYPDGNFVGPTILEADTTMECYQCVAAARPRVLTGTGRRSLGRC